VIGASAAAVRTSGMSAGGTGRSGMSVRPCQ
jgi:hypothetical protein